MSSGEKILAVAAFVCVAFYVQNDENLEKSRNVNNNIW